MPQYKKRLLKILVTNSILGATGFLTPFIYRYILNLVVSSSQQGASAELVHRIILSLFILLVVGLVSALFDYVTGRLSDLLFIDVIWDIRRAVFKHLFSLSIDYYEKTRSGEILERTTAGTFDFAMWVNKISDGYIGTVITLILILIILLVRLPLVGVIATISVGLNLYLSIHRVLKTKPIRRDWHKQAENATGEVTEALTHITTIRSFAQEKYKFDRFIKALTNYKTLRINQFKVDWLTNYSKNLLNAVANSLAIGLVAWGVIKGHNTVGDIILVSLYIQQLRGNIGPITRLIMDTGDIETSAERIVTILDVQPTVTDRPDAQPIQKINTIEFKGVSFHYPDKTQLVLDNISFRLEHGQSLALVGPSGVGKTTVTKLLMRFYAPTAGQILINDEPIEAFTQNSIRELVGTVMQDVALFNDSVEENLRFANPDATQASIKSAAAVAHADIFINKLPDGYQTLVGERGIKLSGGEKQRVAIARAILRDPQLIILDEATSALDSESERYVQDGLKKLLENRTSVIIAHRLSTVRHVDQILVLENGQITERGNHDDLVKNEQLYARLLAMQTGVQEGA